MLKIDGKIVNCIECANLGKPQGCEVCYRKKSRNRIQFEREQGYQIWWRSLSQEERIRIKNEKREIELAAREAQTISDNKEGIREFLYALWEKLHKFGRNAYGQSSTGHPPLDEKLRNLFGDW